MKWREREREREVGKREGKGVKERGREISGEKRGKGSEGERASE